MAVWIDLGIDGDWLNLDQVSRIRDAKDDTLLLWLNNDVNGGTVRASGAVRATILAYLHEAQRELPGTPAREAHPDTSVPEGGRGPTVYQPHTAR